MYYLLTTVVTFLFVYFIVINFERIFPTYNDVFVVLERLIVCLLITNPILFLFYFKTNDYKWAKDWILNVIKKNNG